MQTDVISSGSQQSFSANMNCSANSPPYGYGGRTAETSVFPVRIIMSPISPSSPMARDSTSVLALWATAYGSLSARPGTSP